MAHRTRRNQLCNPAICFAYAYPIAQSIYVCVLRPVRSEVDGRKIKVLHIPCTLFYN